MSKRTVLVKQFFDELAAIGNGALGWEWRRKEMFPLPRINIVECPAFTVFDYQEKVVRESANSNDFSRRQLLLVTEIYVHHTLSDLPSETLDGVLGDVEEGMQGTNLQRMAQRVSLLGSKKRLDSFEQRIVSVQLVHAVFYFLGAK